MPEAGRAEPIIRTASADDADGLGRVSRLAYAATYRGIVPDPVLEEWIDTALAQWRHALESEDSTSQARVWVAERSGTILGYATTSPARDRWLTPPEGAGELTNLYLDPDAIGTGLGRRLYEQAIGDLRERGFNPLVVWAFRDNERARRFYPKMGLAIDVSDHSWELGGDACPIVRFRVDWPTDEAR